MSSTVKPGAAARCGGERGGGDGGCGEPGGAAEYSQLGDRGGGGGIQGGTLVAERRVEIEGEG